MKITIPELSLVALVGPSGSGKSTFARRHFGHFEVLSSDYCRGLVSDDENDQGATKEAFEVLHYIAAKRLDRGRLTVVDATNVQPEARRPLISLAREYHVLPVAIVFNLPERICHDRNRDRPDRSFGPHVVRNQLSQLRKSLRHLRRDGFRHVFVLNDPAEVEAVVIERQPLWNDLRHLSGPFDIIGDVHGCLNELVGLLGELGYAVRVEDEDAGARYHVDAPDGRTAVFLGDLVDRGPDTPGVLKLVMAMVQAGSALCVPGNHDMKLVKALRGRDVQVKHGLAESLDQLSRESPEFRSAAAEFLDGLVSHYVLDGGRLVAAHAGMKEKLQGRGSAKVRDFALYGETTGETDEFGLPVRYNWATEYRGRATVVYGHTPVPEPEWLNNTINIDTGCVFGGKLTALRYPERELVSVPAAAVYAVPVRPFLPEEPAAPAMSAQHRSDDVLDIEDVTGKRIVGTRLRGSVTIREENATAALEVMSRFAANPKWLIYLPPTMSPSETSRQEGLLEHPAEAFAYFRHQGVERLVCQEKHMGSRAIVIVCKGEETAKRRFGVIEGGSGIVYTRTGRRFFGETALEDQFLRRIQAAITASGLWSELDTDWMCLDAELIPWSAKAQDLLRHQYAAVGAAGRASLGETIAVLQSAVDRGQGVDLLQRTTERSGLLAQYVDAYRRYCWNVASVADLKLAPFHVLATEGRTHVSSDHLWHMGTLSRLCAADEGILLATDHRVVETSDAASEAAAIEWWTDLTARGGEGMVVKPLDFVTRGKKDLVQPALKVRGREYLRIIYGPEYTEPHHLERLRSRGLSAKRSLALREFALGVEALERFVQGEPLRRVHECVFGVLAMESEPVDPRL
ncbi:MAG TPA: polynucleotide kinase-phosphatase [Longimicrobiales bacterium]|nr:polynucleotide kinase-phosphatase [Longimicrobiales bacterium]